MTVSGLNDPPTVANPIGDVDVDEDERIRARIGLELFPIPYLQVSGFFTLRDDIPENLRQALPQKDQVSIELHLLF